MVGHAKAQQTVGPSPTPWEKATTLSSVFVSVTVPFIILFLGWRYTGSLESESVRKDLVEISVTILSEPIPEARLVTEGEPDHAVTESDIDRDRYLRDWAVDILEQASPVPIPRDMAEALREGSQILADQANLEELADPAGPDVIESSTSTSSGSSTGTSPATVVTSTSSTPPSATNPAVSGAATLAIENWFGEERAVAVSALTAQGFVVKDFVVCSGSVATGEVRQVLNADETVVYVDIAGTTAAGRSVPKGSVLSVKIGSGTSC